MEFFFENSLKIFWQFRLWIELTAITWKLFFLSPWKNWISLKIFNFRKTISIWKKRKKEKKKISLTFNIERRERKEKKVFTFTDKLQGCHLAFLKNCIPEKKLMAAWPFFRSFLNQTFLKLNLQKITLNCLTFLTWKYNWTMLLGFFRPI